MAEVKHLNVSKERYDLERKAWSETNHELERDRIVLLRRINDLERWIATLNIPWDGIDRRENLSEMVCRYCGLPLCGKDGGD
jgi:hypothetical protein